jgi:hypothetical protein
MYGNLPYLCNCFTPSATNLPSSTLGVSQLVRFGTRPAKVMVLLHLLSQPVPVKMTSLNSGYPELRSEGALPRRWPAGQHPESATPSYGIGRSRQSRRRATLRDVSCEL